MTQQLLYLSLVCIFIFIQQPRWPQSNFLVEVNRAEWQRAYRDFKPGPRVTAELAKIEARRREWNDLLFDDLIGLAEFSIEAQRLELHEYLLRSIALLSAPQDEPPQFIIVESDRRELCRVFPSCKLPVEQLQPNHSYETEPGSRRRVRYLTVFRWSEQGPRFVVFAREPEQR